MLTVFKATVPSYLRSSELYTTLSDDEQDSFTVPVANLKLDDGVGSSEDARHLLSTLRYWGLPVLPDNLMAYLVHGELTVVASLTSEFGKELELLTHIVEIVRERNTSAKLAVAVRLGVLPAVRLLCEGSDLSSTIQADKFGGYCTLAARNGCTDCIEFLRERGFSWSETTCATASRHGHLSCLQYLHEHGCPWDANCCIAAGWAGDLPCLQYALDHGCPWSTHASLACAQSGNAACLRYALEHGGMHYYPEYGPCEIAASAGHLECLKVAREFRCPWNAYTCMLAAHGGHLACLQYARENGCPWGENTCTVAAAYAGRIECLQYLHENGCPWISDCCSVAAHTRNYACLKYAVEHGCPCNALARVAYLRHCTGASLTVAMGFSQPTG